MSQSPDDAAFVTGAARRRVLERLRVPLGLALGFAAYYLLIRVMGVPVEVWDGPSTFAQPVWLANVALVPAVAGFVTGVVCGRHGKWYGMVPVAVIHPVQYFSLAGAHNPDVRVLGAGLFVFFMLVMLELGLMAGWGGEILRNRLAGKDVRA